jgi:pimeloyl-ACP methyl ester carboxylesterase
VSLRNDVLRLGDYAHVASPVLYLSGRATRASTRRIGELLNYALPYVEQDILNGMGHLGPITHAEAVAQRIARFVYRHAGSRVTERLAA